MREIAAEASICGESGKKPYPTKSDALAALQRQRKRAVMGADKMIAYHCPACRSWHLGHPVGHTWREIRQRQYRQFKQSAGQESGEYDV